MNNIKFFLPAILILALSCAKKQGNAVAVTPNVNQELINEIENMNSPAAKKASYVLLNPQERLTLWQRHLANYMGADLSAAQKTHLKALQNYITAETFSDNRDMSKIEQFTEPWYATAKQIFDKTLLNDITSGISNQTYIVSLVSAINTRAENSQLAARLAKSSTLGAQPDDILDCNCATQSDYCNGSLSCASGTGCNIQGYCGFLLSYKCNGKCQDNG